MIIQIDNLVKRYKSLIALDHFHLEVEEGEILGLLGPNGSGKTTAINCMLSLLKYDKGSIRIFGRDMTAESYDIKRNIGIVMQNVAVFDTLSVEENIAYFCSLYIKDRWLCKQYVEEAIRFVELQEYRKFRPSKLSGGLRRRLNIACGIAHKPKLVILDEPTVAVDPQSRNKILEGIRKLNQQGATIIYTTHYMEEVEQICTRIVILDKGKQIAEGTAEQLKAMITLKEKIDIEQIALDERQLQAIRELANVFDVVYNQSHLQVKFTKGKQNLMNLLDYLKQEDVPFGKVYSQLPTLNDVFLEITGKGLRD
ncbi:MAG: ABC transporter ATP-binding protein [Erysipelotrichaceae bacterium]|jgi:ABC-2 type transport system ATP-binding protein|nr:ABC transporter ATP-binding protein [Erysipelotrichaceae bacterium]